MDPRPIWRQIAVVVVNMRVISGDVDSHPKGKADSRRYADAGERETRAMGVELVDMGIWPAPYLAHPAHLDARGSARINGMFDEIPAEARPS